MKPRCALKTDDPCGNDPITTICEHNIQCFERSWAGTSQNVVTLPGQVVCHDQQGRHTPLVRSEFQAVSQTVATRGVARFSPKGKCAQETVCIRDELIDDSCHRLYKLSSLMFVFRGLANDPNGGTNAVHLLMPRGAPRA